MAVLGRLPPEEDAGALLRMRAVGRGLSRAQGPASRGAPLHGWEGGSPAFRVTTERWDSVLPQGPPSLCPGLASILTRLLLWGS